MVHKGDALNNIYLVCNGSMEVLQKDMVVAILGKGDLVGCDIPSTLTIESVIKSSSDVKALTYCDLKCIHVPGLLEVLKLYPEFAETFCTEIVHDLTFNLREGYETDSEGVLHGAHSLTLPSISEDDENNEEDDDNDERDNFGGDNDDWILEFLNANNPNAAKLISESISIGLSSAIFIDIINSFLIRIKILQSINSIFFLFFLN